MLDKLYQFEPLAIKKVSTLIEIKILLVIVYTCSLGIKLKREN
jgi:hypothetical protein